MDMNTFIGILAGLAIGFIYYRLSFKKSFQVFLLLNDQPLSRVNEQVRERLTVRFSSPLPPNDPVDPIQNAELPAIEVGHLQHLQFILRNGGVRGIKFDVSPWFEIPAGTIVLDAGLVYKSPSELDASIALQPSAERNPQKISIAIPLLNRYEFVLVKLLLADAIDPNSLVFHAVAEDLIPRQFSVTQLPPDSTRSLVESFDWAAVSAGLFMVAFALATYFSCNGALSSNPFPEFDLNTLGKFLSNVKAIHVAICFGWFGAIIVGFIGLLLIFDLGFQKFAFWKRVVLPPDLRPLGG